VLKPQLGSLGSDVADRVCELCRAVQSMPKCASYVILAFELCFLG
jgi:hypothetical protein